MAYDESQDQSQGGDGGSNVQEALNEADPAFISGDAGKKGPSKSTFLLIGLLVLGAGLVYFMYFRNGPSSAQGGSSKEAGAAIDQFLKVDSGNITLMKQTLKDSEKVVDQFLSYPGKKQVPIGDLRSNPFRETAQKENTPAPLPTDPNAKRLEQERRNAADAFASLHLQSVIHGAKRRACMISNKFVQEGQEIEGFIVKQVAGNTVELRWKKEPSIKYELAMKQPNQ